MSDGEDYYACPSCKIRLVSGELELCSLCKGPGGFEARAVTCTKCGSSFASTHGHGMCPTCLLPDYSRGGVTVSGTVSLLGEGGWETVATTAPGTVTIHYTEPFSGVILDHGELDLGLGLEPVRGVGLTSLMLMDAAERKRAGLPVRIVVALDREIGHMMSNPVLEDSGMRRDDFMTLAAASQGRLRGHERSSVFVDHHVWEAGSQTYLDLLRFELSYLR